jgi:predicted AAA+ superfamily ATPase
MNKNRYLADVLEEMAFRFGKMAVVSGPRQVGKTTMARQILKARDIGAYHTWDDIDFRKVWVKGPTQVAGLVLHGTKDGERMPLLILDELHKDKKWKNSLKGLFDLFHDQMNILVTGSARLNVFKKGGDSLLGRYFSFRLHPLSVAELCDSRLDEPLSLIDTLWSGQRKAPPSVRETFEKLLKFGGFPDPYFNADERFSNLWRVGRLEKIIREDLRDLSRLPELSQVELLAALLPEKIGSTLSIQSLRQDLEVAHDTIKRWLQYLESLYFHFVVKPYSKRLPRSLKKEPKIYLYDWSEISNEGSRFENLVASHLLKACDYWTDAGHGAWQLHYLRNKEKQEVDFLITAKGKPFISIECKVQDDTLDPAIFAFAKHLGLRHHIQIVQAPDVWRLMERDGINILVASAELVLRHLV